MTFLKIVGILALLMVGYLALLALGFTLGWFNEAAQVAQEELGPRAVLEKYEWFKDASAQLDKKNADIGVYEARTLAMDASYGGGPRIHWARDDREQYNVWKSEVAGIKASFNQLAAEYNANHVKINYRFADVGNLPKGAVEPLPREFKPYVMQ